MEETLAPNAKSHDVIEVIDSSAPPIKERDRVLVEFYPRRIPRKLYDQQEPHDGKDRTCPRQHPKDNGCNADGEDKRAEKKPRERRVRIHIHHDRIEIVGLSARNLSGNDRWGLADHSRDP